MLFIEFIELFTLPLGVGDVILPTSRGLSPSTIGTFSCIVPSEVCMFLLAGGSPVAAPGWPFFDLNKKAMVDICVPFCFFVLVCSWIFCTDSSSNVTRSRLALAYVIGFCSDRIVCRPSLPHPYLPYWLLIV